MEKSLHEKGHLRRNAKIIKAYAFFKTDDFASSSLQGESGPTIDMRT